MCKDFGPSESWVISMFRGCKMQSNRQVLCGDGQTMKDYLLLQSSGLLRVEPSSGTDPSSRYVRYFDDVQSSSCALPDMREKSVQS